MIKTWTHSPTPTKGTKSILIVILENLSTELNTSLEWYHHSEAYMTITAGQAERASICLRDVPLHSEERGPVVLKVTLYHQEKSLMRDEETNLPSPGLSSPASASISLLAFQQTQDMNVVTADACFFFFSNLPHVAAQLAVQHISTTFKYGWQLLRRCPLSHHMHWQTAYHNRAMSITTLSTQHLCLSEVLQYSQIKVSH